MSEAGAPVLLQVSPNDHPPFADICRYYAAAARMLSWRIVTVMLERRAAAPVPAFHYLDEPFPRAAERLLDGRQPVFSLCHRYRAYRAVMKSRVLESPVVAVAHEFGFFRRRRRRWQRSFDRALGRPPALFAGVSDAVQRELAATTDDAVLLPNGLDLARVDDERLPRDDALRALGLSPGVFHVGVVGRLHPKKNPLLAVDAFARAARDMPGARLVFLGDGELADRVRAGAVDLPVVQSGFVPDAARLMSAFDVLLMPSGEREAFGMVAVEAMAAGVPVLCGPAPGPRFVVGDTGRHFAANDPDEVAGALRALHADWRRGSLAELAGRARSRVEREFSVAAAAGRLEALAVS